ncbi:PhoX family protein [Aquipuribacter sp. SD81]|uniref:PhoX family protein n=1 Tax=Aquipuribacter sp. SD81 TaxID=3127703 RepID=UPI003018CCA3
MLGQTHGSRSASVCHWKCADACARPDENTSGNERFVDVARRALARRTSRRSVLAGSAAGAALAALSGIAPAAAAPKGRGAAARSGSLAFSPIAPVGNTVDAVTVPDGWRWETIIAWGDPVEADAPAWDPAHQTPEAQKKQFGYNNDYLDVVPFRGNGNRGLLVANHEYTNDELMFPATSDPAQRLLDLETAMYAHGMSVVEVRRRGKDAAWQPLRRSPFNRRITLDTEFVLDGPAAGSPLLRTSEDPTGTRVYGTLNNCAGSTTPWGTVLSGEENVDQYFTGAPDPTAREARYGLNTAGRGWGAVQDRFDLSNAGTRNEPNRFNWVVEVDPEAPDEAPVKHTAMGRFKHEGAHVTIAASGHAVAYSGDDNRFDYLYKFVSRDTFRPGPSQAARRHNKTLLSDGDLYVAKFHGDGEGIAEGDYDGTGEWLPLYVDGRSMVPGFTAEEVLVYTRLAADAVGATGMDRPEDVEPSPVTGYVYMACTNNTRRTGAQVDEPNPRPNNKDGHVIELREDGDDATGTSFTWNILLLCGDPEDPTVTTYFGGWDGPVSPISCPDNVAFDDAGNLWVSTDGQPGTINYNDGLFLVPVEGPERGRVQQFLAVPTGAETCGPQVKARDGYVLVAVQHPGDLGGASYENPRSAFPYDGVFAGPRPACIQVLPA